MCLSPSDELNIPMAARIIIPRPFWASTLKFWILHYKNLGMEKDTIIVKLRLRMNFSHETIELHDGV